MSTVVLEAPAKLTLSLRITGVRDDGYHLIDAEMVTLQWHDTLSIDTGSTGLTAEGPYAKGMPLDASNLVAKALRHVGRTAAVHIRKELPYGGGLGGGSADAAAVLRWAGYDDVAGAAALGADVAFCLVGGKARVRGIGEIVEPLPFEAIDITLVIPPIAVSSPFVYGMWDDMGGPRGDGLNDLEPAAVHAFTAMGRWRDRIREAAGVAPTLAGSGATWFLRGHHDLGAALPEAVVVRTGTCP
ncbi:MAG: 4-(cytidine 5'-diphospho)-2-C-methyl-D-erythritol kinase [Ilumatobacteraceae bacterium]